MTDDCLKLLEIAGRECECIDNSDGICCAACEAAGALNLCAEIMSDALDELKGTE